MQDQEKKELLDEQILKIRNALAKIKEINPETNVLFLMEAKFETNFIADGYALVAPSDGWESDTIDNLGQFLSAGTKAAAGEQHLEVSTNFIYLLSLLHFGLIYACEPYRKGAEIMRDKLMQYDTEEAQVIEETKNTSDEQLESPGRDQ